MTIKLTYLMTTYYTPNDSFTAYDASFYKNKFDQLLCTHHNVFPSTVNTINTYVNNKVNEYPYLWLIFTDFLLLVSMLDLIVVKLPTVFNGYCIYPFFITCREFSIVRSCLMGVSFKVPITAIDSACGQHCPHTT